MLTGNLPVAEEAVWTNHPDNLFTILAPTHELEVIEQATELCPYDVCAPTAAADGPGGTGALEASAGPGSVMRSASPATSGSTASRLGEAGPPDLDDFAEAVADRPSSTTTTTTRRARRSRRARPEDRPTPDEGQALTSVRSQTR